MKVKKSTKIEVPKWTAEAVCQCCESVLIIDESDLFKEENGGFLKARFVCCECNKKSNFCGYPEPSILPEYWEHPPLGDALTGKNLNTDKPKLRLIDGRTVFEFESA